MLNSKWLAGSLVLVVLMLWSARPLRENMELLRIARPVMNGVGIDSNCRPVSKLLAERLLEAGSRQAQAGFRAIAFDLKRKQCAEDAERVWHSALTLEPVDVVTAGSLGLELEAQGRLDEAEPWLLKGRLGLIVGWRRIDSGEAAMQRRDFARAAGMLVAGLRLGDSAIERAASEPSLLSETLAAKWREQRYGLLRDIGYAYYNWPMHLAQAEEYYRRSLAAAESPYTRSLLAQALMQDGCSLEAIELLRLALKHRPQYPMALRLLSWAEAACGNYRAAAEAAREAIKAHKPIPVELRFECGSVLWRAGYRDEALIQWRAAVQEAPRHPYASMIPEAAKRLLDPAFIPH
jgi:tetratricopeptide (TPR) repeat protein